MVNLEFSGRFPTSLDKETVKKLVQKTLRMAEYAGSANISLSLVDDREIRKLNRQWRGMDKATDVLSFNFPKGRSPLAGKGLVPQLGDIVISIETVRRQAKANRRTVREELALMVVHGCLHLLGFDHDTPGKESRMFQKQQDILISAGIL